MKKKFLGIICLLYAGMIFYVWVSGKIKNFLAPQMQIYIKISLFVILFIGIIMILNNNTHYKFKVIDIVLLLPLLMIFATGDGVLTASLANNRSNTFVNRQNKENENNNENVQILKPNSKKEKDDNPDEPIKKEETYDFSTVDYDVVDESYEMITYILSYPDNPNKYVGKKIRLRGFSV